VAASSLMHISARSERGIPADARLRHQGRRWAGPAHAGCHAPAISTPSVEHGEPPRWMRSSWIETTHRRHEFGEPTEAHARQLAGLETRDRRLRETARSGQVALRPSDHRPTPLDHGADDLPAALELRISLESFDLIPSHPRKPRRPPLSRAYRPSPMPPMCIADQGSSRPGENVHRPANGADGD
jgi:hypothetical protein